MEIDSLATRLFVGGEAIHAPRSTRFGWRVLNGVLQADDLRMQAAFLEVVQ